MKITQEELDKIITAHGRWLRDEPGGVLANLSGMGLSGMDLSGLDLRGANLSWANLFGSNLSNANLRWANLRWANLHRANLHRADLREADLYRADLRKADLRWADLRETNLRETVGNMEEIKSLQLDLYGITYTNEVMAIGCQQHSIADWWEFTDDEIASMDEGALHWWRNWKPFLQQIIESSPATPTGHGGGEQ